MLTKLRAAGLILPTLLALSSLVVLVGLGNWQMSRKAWKDALVQQIEAGLRSAPVALGEALRGWPCLAAKNCLFPEYARVRVRGRFEHDRERYFYAPDPSLGPGVHVYTPLVLEDGRRVMVNRGFVPEQLRAPAKREAGQSKGTIEIVGLLRGPGEKAMFTPENDQDGNLWFWRDLGGMSGCGAEARGSYCASYVRAFVDAEAEPANPGGWPKGGATNLQIANRHLEYALTWYGLALVLVGIYGVFARSRVAAAEKLVSTH